MLKWILGTILGVVLGLLVYFSWYLGVFKPVNLVEKQVGPLHLLYKNHVGAYHKIVPVLNEVEKWAKENHISCERTFGEYLDNPNTVEEGRLRANAGCVIAESSPVASSAAVAAPLLTQLPAQLPEGYFTREVPAKKYVTVVFEGSPGIGPMVVYPKVTDYFDAKRATIAGPVFELYKITSEKSMSTTYLFPME